MQPTTLRAFVRSLLSSWLTGMSGPLSVPLTIAAVFVPSHVVKIGLGVTAFVCFWGAAYGVWAQERIARNAAEATLTKERPYISIHGISFQHTQGARPPRITYNVTNIGKLAAKVENVSIRCGMELSQPPPLLLLFPPSRIIGDHLLLQMPILSSGEERANIEYDVPNELLKRDPPIRWPIDQMIFQVVVTYRGPFTKGHETAQCWRFTWSPRKGFVENPDPRYTYTR
jgi:hypothetical protein